MMPPDARPPDLDAAVGGRGALPGRRPGTQRPDAGVTRLVQLNCQQLFPQEGVLVEAFRQTLTQLIPAMRRHDPQRDRQLAAEIVRGILWSALTREPPGAVEATLQRLGGDHHRHGLPPDGYLSVGHALLRSAKAVTDVGWSSELSSAWVAYYSWLAEQFTAGAATAHAEDAQRPPDAAGSATAPPGSLDAVLAELHGRYFADDPQGLDAICARVMLRTGADVRAPRPDQRTDPAVIADVLGVLLVLGYSVSGPAAHLPGAPASPGPSPTAPAPWAAAPGQPAPGPPGATPRATPVPGPEAGRAAGRRAGTEPARRRWSHPFRRRES